MQKKHPISDPQMLLLWLNSAGYSQREFAAYMKVNQSTVYRWLKGEVPQHIMNYISAVDPYIERENRRMDSTRGIE